MQYCVIFCLYICTSSSASLFCLFFLYLRRLYTKFRVFASPALSRPSKRRNHSQKFCVRCKSLLYCYMQKERTVFLFDTRFLFHVKHYFLVFVSYTAYTPLRARSVPYMLLFFTKMSAFFLLQGVFAAFSVFLAQKESRGNKLWRSRGRDQGEKIRRQTRKTSPNLRMCGEKNGITEASRARNAAKACR